MVHNFEPARIFVGDNYSQVTNAFLFSFNKNGNKKKDDFTMYYGIKLRISIDTPCFFKMYEVKGK